jgi:hypothetical protein
MANHDKQGACGEEKPYIPVSIEIRQVKGVVTRKAAAAKVPQNISANCNHPQMGRACRK